MDASARIFAPYFQNRLSEMHRNFEEVGQVVEVGPIWHIPGPLNPADLPTRLDGSAEDLRQGSTWMSGPPFLYLPRDQMPLSRDFLSSPFTLPTTELRSTKVALLATHFLEQNMYTCTV